MHFELSLEIDKKIVQLGRPGGKLPAGPHQLTGGISIKTNLLCIWNYFPVIKNALFRYQAWFFQLENCKLNNI